MTEINNTTKITEDEAKVYDRQIRLWGLDAQKRLRGAKVLLVGLGGLGAEVAKNIILVGVQSVHLLDDKEITFFDLKSQFFLRREHLHKNRAETSLKLSQLLNPMVKVTAENASVTSKSPEYFKNFDVVVLMDLDWTTAAKINKFCRQYDTKLFLASAFGIYGYFFSDLGKHEYAVDVIEKKENQSKNDGEPQTKKMKIEEESHKTIKNVIEFKSLEEVFSYDWGKAKHSIAKKTLDGFFFSKLVSDFVQQHNRIPLDVHKDKEFLSTHLLKVTNEMGIPQDKIHSEMIEECYMQLSPVCAIMGALVAQEVIKVVSKKDLPHDNFVFFDGHNGASYVDKIA